MYHAHWGLRQSPYSERPDPARFYHSPVHREALARLHFLVDEHRRIGLLLGGAGTGKSLLCQVFASHMSRAACPVAVVDLLGIGPREMLWEIAAQWGLNPRPDAKLFELGRQLSDRLCECRLLRLSAVALLDNADQATPEVLQHVLRLAVCDPAPESRFTTVLTACPSRVLVLGERLLELAALRIDLEPWEEADTLEFLTHMLRQAGGRAEAFDRQAMQRLHALSQGIPRRVSQLADLALLAGAGEQLPQIDCETVESVYHELGVI